MLMNRRRFAILLMIIAGISYWLLQFLAEKESISLLEQAHYPDYYMENFATLVMTADGSPKNRLIAGRMAHYPYYDTALHHPRMEIFQGLEPPVHISSDVGLVTPDNEVILLFGNVRLHQNDKDGNKDLEVIADDARIMVNENYAETFKVATVIRKHTVINSVGMRAYMGEQRMEFFSDVYTTIEPKNAH